MTSPFHFQSKFQLTPDRLNLVLNEIKQKLAGRIQAAYVFGSASTGEISPDSDIDLILVKTEVSALFPKRAIEFIDLYEIYPNLDILVYTQQELDAQLANSELGFWKSVRLSMMRIL
jgi:predicted nucleotidyltransferase